MHSRWGGGDGEPHKPIFASGTWLSHGIFGTRLLLRSLRPTLFSENFLAWLFKGWSSIYADWVNVRQTYDIGAITIIAINARYDKEF